LISALLITELTSSQISGSANSNASGANTKCQGLKGNLFI
jgi:hypothetical protein